VLYLTAPLALGFYTESYFIATGFPRGASRRIDTHMAHQPRPFEAIWRAPFLRDSFTPATPLAADTSRLQQFTLVLMARTIEDFASDCLMSVVAALSAATRSPLTFHRHGFLLYRYSLAAASPPAQAEPTLDSISHATATPFIPSFR